MPGTGVTRIDSYMWEWILIAALYVLGIGFLRFLGGVGAAADALRRRMLAP